MQKPPQVWTHEGIVVPRKLVSLLVTFSVAVLHEVLCFIVADLFWEVQEYRPTGESNHTPFRVTTTLLLYPLRHRCSTTGAVSSSPCDWWTLRTDRGLRRQIESGPQLRSQKHIWTQRSKLPPVISHRKLSMGT